jgi:putative colanic acid biosysnthesis UDP-glucose lipid carrier transferase
LSARYSKYLPIISFSGDFILLNLIFIAGFCIITGTKVCMQPAFFPLYIYLNFIWLALIIVFKSKEYSYPISKKSLVVANSKGIVFFFFLFLIFFQIQSLNYLPRNYIGIIFPLFFALLLVWKLGLYYAFVIYRRMGYNYKNVIIVGITKNSQALRDYFLRDSLNGYRFQGFIDHQKSKRRSVIGNWDELKDIIENKQIDEIYIGWSALPKEAKPKITAAIRHFPLKVRIVPDFGEFSYKSAELVNYDLIPVIQIHQGPLGYWYNRWIKRVFDVTFSVVMILFFLSWISAVLWVLSLLGSREGVFFLQKRTGIDGRIFKCIKFRTMRHNVEADSQQATRYDKRITPVGRFLRKTSIDELPQFVNVLLGQMSVAGPRPHMLKHTSQYRKVIGSFMLRHTVKPGITGLAQVRGYRGEVRRLSDIRQRVALDVNYIENWSFLLDLKIILITINNLFKGDKKAF